MNKKDDNFFSLSVRPASLLISAGIVLSLTTLFGCLGRISWALDLFSHFRVQYLFTLCIISLILFVLKRRKIAVVFLAVAFINLFIILPLYFGGQKVAPGDKPTLRVMLLNVNSRLGDPELVKNVIQTFDPDIVVLEEITSQWIRDLQEISKSHPHSRTQPRGDNFGIGLFSKLPLTESAVVYIGNNEIPSITAALNDEQRTFNIIATHPLPPGSASYAEKRNTQLDHMQNYIPENSPVMLLGDLNVTPWNYYFKKMRKSTGLLDSSKGRGIQTTWPNFNPLLAIPLDHCLHSSDIIIHKKQIGPDVGSDHYPVILDFSIGSISK